MCQNTNFNWEVFITMVNNMSCNHSEIQFSCLEKFLLKCDWFGMTEKEIFEALDKNRAKFKHYYINQYYIRGGFKPNIMRKLSQLINQPVNKNNFKEVFQRRWEEYNRTNF